MDEPDGDRTATMVLRLRTFVGSRGEWLLRSTVPSNPIGLEMMSTLNSVIFAWNVKVAVQRIFHKPDLVATNLPTNAWNRWLISKCGDEFLICMNQ